MKPTAEVQTEGPTRGQRFHTPVFIVGCVRSGTTLLYHMLLSAGGFAVYRTETHALNLLEPRFGDLSVRKNRQRLMEVWLDSKLFNESGLEGEFITTKVLDECRNGGDFLRIVMGEIARKQGMLRWAECTPEHVLCLPRIRETLPDALIIHIIRDGRDVALSTMKQGWIRPFPWDRGRPLAACALYWEWMVRKGREDGALFGANYREVLFEDLVAHPARELARLSEFIGQELDYERIRKVGIGSVSSPNSSFSSEPSQFNPVGRWRESLSQQDLQILEGLCGDLLLELGYPLSHVGTALNGRLHLSRLRATYLNWFKLKLWAKHKTPLGPLLVTKKLTWL